MSSETNEITVRPIVAGDAAGPALVLDEPVSLWGGFDATTGCIIDQLHPQHGVCLTGAVVFMYSGRGSSSASSVLAEAIRLGTAPAAFVLVQPDEILALGALVGEEIYGTATPIVIAARADTEAIKAGQQLTVTPSSIRL